MRIPFVRRLVCKVFKVHKVSLRAAKETKNLQMMVIMRRGQKEGGEAENLSLSLSHSTEDGFTYKSHAAIVTLGRLTDNDNNTTTTENSRWQLVLGFHPRVI